MSFALVVMPLGAQDGGMAKAARELDEYAQELRAEIVTEAMTEFLQADREFVARMLNENKVKGSELVFARMLADKTGKPSEDILKRRADGEWSAALKAAGVETTAVVEQLEGAYAELAFRKLDRSSGKRVAKRQR